jgi:transcriptional regulator with XRE-family HTH domain
MARPAKPIDASTLSGRIGGEVRRRRERAKLTVEQAAEKAGCPPATWYNWESGRFDLPVSRLPAIAAALGCQARDLVPKK